MSGSDVLTSLVQNDGVDPSNYGVTTIPLTSAANAGVLSGGTVAVGNVKDTEAQKAAVAKWIDFYYGQPAVDKGRCCDAGQALQASKQVVGAPSLPIFDAAQAAEARSWIKPYATPGCVRQRCAVHGQHRKPAHRAGAEQAHPGPLRCARLGGAGRAHPAEPPTWTRCSRP
ncbi:MAG: hypothetical protein WDM88_13580 [Galbitalea sp.]